MKKTNEWKNGVFEGTYYSRFIASWNNVEFAGKIDHRFKEWLRSLTINGKKMPEDVVQDIFNLATNGKFELEKQVYGFVKKYDETHTTKVVINRCYGGFGLSKEACEYLSIDDPYEFLSKGRDNPKLVECVEKLGERANGNCSRLEIVEVPSRFTWYIEEYDGMENVRY